MLLAAAGPFSFELRVSWPMHQAARELHQRASGLGLARQLPAPLEFRASADSGVELIGAGRAIREILQDEGFAVSDNGGRLIPTAAFLTEARREFMTTDASIAGLYRAAGLRWAALSSTSAKNRETASASSRSTVASKIPKRANDDVNELAWVATKRKLPA